MMTDTKNLLDQIRSDIDRVLVRYNVPMDDRTFVLERVDGLKFLMEKEREDFERGIGAVRTEINRERATVRKQVAGIRDTAVRHVDDLEARIDEAYREGVAQGLSQTPPKPGLFQILIGVSLTALAAFVVFRELFPRSKS